MGVGRPAIRLDWFRGSLAFAVASDAHRDDLIFDWPVGPLTLFRWMVVLPLAIQ